MERKTVFVVGLGMVGIAFIEKLLNLDTAGQYRIVTCGEEMHLAYNRVALTEYFQHRSVEKLYLNSAEWYTQQDPGRFTFYVGEAVTELDTAAYRVTTDHGRVISYDYCVLATGSEATIPPYADTHIPGVFVYRNISDMNRLLAYAEQDTARGKEAVVLGGGLLGLEAAKAVYDLETVGQVTIVHRQVHPLSRQLDAHGGGIVRTRIEALGVTWCGSTSGTALRMDETGALEGLELDDGSVLPCRIAVFAIGITPRDDLARKAGLKCAPRGGIVVDDELRTSAQDVWAIGECASWKENTYGLIAPGIEMADILSFNFTQTQTSMGGFKPRTMNNPDLSTKLKLMGVDVASFGDYFAERRRAASANSEGTPSKPKDASAPRRRHGVATIAENGPVETLTYRDPFAGVYKKYIFNADGKYLLGGMMVGDTSDYIKLVAIVKKKKVLEVPPAQFILGTGGSKDDSGADLDDDTQICSCHNVTKVQIVQCVKHGAQTLADVKTKTKAGTGCGGCMPLVTNIFKAEMKKAGYVVNNNLCPHFTMTRVDLFNVIKIKQLRTMPEVMTSVGVKGDSLGCEICKPAVASVLSSLWNEPIMDPVHHANQETNDRFLANIQRNGTFSVVPRIAAGEITPEKLIVLGQVAKKYGLYTKITGGQRIDMFGAQKPDLPSIWKELIDAGFESGHAYGKALRTVKSCVGTSWCRYGVGDSVTMAVKLEERYKGIRSPHKLKGGISGCVRECAEAQGKDFGLIATDKGWNIFICGNGGTNPRHATLLAADVPPSKAIRIVDRFLMYYIRTADKLTRTSKWLDAMEGGIEKLKRVLLDDELGICEDLEHEMDAIVGTYFDEWRAVVEDPERQKQFRQFVNSDERRAPVEQIVERGQSRPANWPKEFPSARIRESDVPTPKSQWKWRKLAKVQDLMPIDAGATSAAVKYGDSQLAIFHVPRRGYYATQQMCPHKRAFVLEHGIIGDDPKSGTLYVSCPMHKRNFTLTSGDCLNDDAYSILAFDVRMEDEDISLLLPEPNALDAVIGTSKWMVRQATAELFEKGSTGGIEIVGPVDSDDEGMQGANSCGAERPSCVGSKFDW
ncbi:nitrite reductase [Obba rivulosa]|uniref:Nitrite reductase [NAD(P)H] n=1 Tax=Obba rivulosa TaxID=1052685 RepID=A0A8E2ASK0_9APHY|nr:nitrite reductase [Obba rivulosa]